MPLIEDKKPNPVLQHRMPDRLCMVRLTRYGGEYIEIRDVPEDDRDAIVRALETCGYEECGTGREREE